MPFTMLVPTMNVFLPFGTVSLYLLFPGTVFCCQKGLSFSGKWFLTGLGGWFYFLYTGVWWWWCSNISFSLQFFTSLSNTSSQVFWSEANLFLVSNGIFWWDWSFRVCLVSVCHFCLPFSLFNVSVGCFINISFSPISCLSLLFSSFSISILLLSIPISSFLVYAGIAWWI